VKNILDKINWAYVVVGCCISLFAINLYRGQHEIAFLCLMTGLIFFILNNIETHYNYLYKLGQHREQMNQVLFTKLYLRIVQLEGAKKETKPEEIDPDKLHDAYESH